MKYKSILPIISQILLITSLLILSNCGSQDGPEPDPEPCVEQYGKWWWTQPTAEDAIYGVGISKKQQTQLSRSAAAGNARDEIARSVEVKVKNMLSQFMQESGIGESAQALSFSEDVSKQVANMTLAGSKPVCYHKIAGETYCLVAYPIGQIRANTLEEANKAALKEEALYNEFKAKQGFEALDKEVEKMSGE